MAAIQHLLQRWGFVKLGRFGLVLNPDGRILSTRPAVLDDGTGGRIVGWQEDDLAMAELQPWEPASPASKRAARRAATAQPAVQIIPPANRPAIPSPSPLAAAQITAPQPSYQAVISEASVLAMRPAAGSEPRAAVVVAPAPTVDEDDWEWTIALARARVATDTGAVALSPPDLQPPVTRVAPEPILPARTRPMPVVATKDPSTSGEWPRTEPIGAIDYADHSRAATRPAMASPRVVAAAPPPAMPQAAAPVTVIPVPALPTMNGTARAGRLAPVVRPNPSRAPAASPRRFPKGTGPVDPRTTSRMAAMSDDTQLTFSVGDRTTPGIVLPPAARAVELPSIKRKNVPR